MPNPRNENHAIRLGTYTSIDITSTYYIVNWASQSDMVVDNQNVAYWLAPYQSLPPEYARVVVMADGTAKGDGYLKGALGPFGYWTFGMLSYLNSTYFPGGVYSSLVSMLLYDISDTAIYLNATLYRPVIGQDIEPVFGGWKVNQIRYDIGTLTS